MKTSMGGVHPRATLRRMGWIDRGEIAQKLTKTSMGGCLTAAGLD